MTGYLHYSYCPFVGPNWSLDTGFVGLQIYNCSYVPQHNPKFEFKVGMVIEKPEDIEIKLRNSQDSLKSVPCCTLNYARSTEVIIPLSNTVIHSSVSAVYFLGCRKWFFLSYNMCVTMNQKHPTTITSVPLSMIILLIFRKDAEP